MKGIAILLLFSLTGKVNVHPVKITNATITYKKETGSLNITINFFADDLGDHLKKIYRQREFDFSNPQKTEQDVVRDYIVKNLLIKINHKQQTLVLQDIQTTEDNVVQITLSIPDLKGTTITVMEFNDELLLDAFDNQVNLIHVDLADETHVFRFMNGDAYCMMTTKYVCH